MARLGAEDDVQDTQHSGGRVPFNKQYLQQCSTIIHPTVVGIDFFPNFSTKLGNIQESISIVHFAIQNYYDIQSMLVCPQGLARRVPKPAIPLVTLTINVTPTPTISVLLTTYIFICLAESLLLVLLLDSTTL